MKTKESRKYAILAIVSNMLMLFGCAVGMKENKVTPTEPDNIIVTKDQNNDNLKVKKIGDHYEGGIVFYVDETGQHGLIASLRDLTLPDGTAYIAWHDGEHIYTNATSDGIGAGARNTEEIVKVLGKVGGNFAAKLAADLSVQSNGNSPCTGAANEICYNDWYLPSKAELNLLYNQRNYVNGLVVDVYWSSNDSETHYAWSQGFDDLGDQKPFPKAIPGRVRAVRVF